MNCDECKDQVFELIEREKHDPVGVARILEPCPECRKAFDELKASLALGAQMPLEEPPARIDAEVLAAAEERHRAPLRDTDEPNVIPFDQGRFQRLPWAVAAVAVLGLGYGYFQLGGGTGVDDSLAMKGERSLETMGVESDVAAPSAPAEDFGGAREQAQVGAVAARTSPPAASEEVSRQLAKSGASGKKAKRSAPRLDAQEMRSREVARKKEAVEEAPARLAEVKQAPAPAAAGAMLADAEEQADAAPADAPAKDRASQCRARVARFEAQEKSDRDFQPTPEAQLDAGRCYAELGQKKRARRWLERAATEPKTADRAKAALRELEASSR